MTPSHALVAYCRAGFEGEAGADLHRMAAACDARLDLSAAPGTGYVIGTIDDDRPASARAAAPRTAFAPIHAAVDAASPIFTRSVVVARGPFVLAPPVAAHVRPGPSRIDRVTPLLAAIAAAATPPWRSLWIEFPDTNDGKALSSLARALAQRAEPALRERGDLRDDAPSRLHVFLPDGSTAWIGTSVARDNEWPMGIARMRMPGAAPSRSTLKLAEAFATFLGADERALLRPGMHAVDLGAAPGGWTWQLAQRGIRVTAVDNGPLKGAVAQDSLVTHVRDDAFRYRPRRPVDWLVCDVVETPIRIAELVAQWVAEGRARRAMFNLKLPMKKRYDEVRRCMQRMDEITRAAGVPATLAVRQLYHDREEVTGYLARD